MPHDPGPHWGEVGIHGLHRQRDWDAVVTVAAPGEPGAVVTIVALSDGGVRIEDGVTEVDPAALLATVPVAPPYRAVAVERGGFWVVGVRQLEVVALADDPGVDEVVVVWDGAERTVRFDGEPTLAGVLELERLGAARYATYVVTARRLAGRAWEVDIAPL